MAPVFDHFLILDFETTSYGSNFDYPFEIIQFSVAVVDARTKRIRTDVSFNKYVRPVINPILTEHCQSFTGIEQKSLNEADLFQDVYYQFLRWLSNNNFIEKKFVMVCDSRQDLWRIAQWQFRYCGIIMPPFFRQYVNLWRTFEWEQERLGTKVLVKDTNIGKMCEYYNVEFIGRAHDALNDVLNLALVVEKMLESGAHITVNEELVCRTVWRKTPLKIPCNWRQDFFESMKVFERVLPLATIMIRQNQYDIGNYNMCRYCKSPASECGKKHRQFPAYLYNGQAGSIEFARHVKNFR